MNKRTLEYTFENKTHTDSWRLVCWRILHIAHWSRVIIHNNNTSRHYFIEKLTLMDISVIKWFINCASGTFHYICFKKLSINWFNNLPNILNLQMIYPLLSIRTITGNLYDRLIYKLEKGRGLPGVMANILYCDIVVSKFELQLCYYVHFRPINIRKSSSCRAASTDIPDPLSPLLPIIHRLRQVFRVTSCVLT